MVGDDRMVKLGDNTYAQIAWHRYTGCAMQRGTGYGVRHIWGEPWNPDGFTAGWNLCYMPFWAGMLTEDHHPFPQLKDAIRQASWDLYFRQDPVCSPPDFVRDPGLNLRELLGDQPLLVMAPKSEQQLRPIITYDNPTDPPKLPTNSKPFEQAAAIRTQRRQSWSNLYKAVLAFQSKPHPPFGTSNVEASAMSDVRKILRETGLSPAELQSLLEKQPSVKDLM